MENEDDPFSGSWRFNRERSQLNTPEPKQWFQEIRLIDGEVVVRERVVRSDGIEMVVSVRARFDERDYAVEGSPIADTIAYKRVDMNTISGVGKKNGFISIVETLRAIPEQGTLTLSYTAYAGSRVISEGKAVFEKEL